MLLFYDTRKARPTFKRTQELCALRDCLSSAIDGTLSIEIESMHIGERRIEDIGFGMYAVFECYHTKPIAQAFYESHCRFIDFQLIVMGAEHVWVGDTESCDEHVSYNEENDIIIYKTPCSDIRHQLVMLQPRSLAVFFPDDVHASGLSINDTTQVVHKCVVKVPCELIHLSF